MYFANRPLRRSLVFRLTWSYTILLLVIAAILLGGVYLRLRKMTLERESDSIVWRLALFESAFESGGLEAFRALARVPTESDEPIFFIQLVASDNRVLDPGDEQAWSGFRPQRLASTEPPAGDETVWTTLDADANQLVVASRRLRDGSILRIGRSTAESRRVLYAYAWIALVCFGLAIPAGFVGGSMVAHRAFAPVREVTAAVEAILTSGRFDAKVPIAGSSVEIDALAECFNELLTRIEKSMKGLSESLDYIAHDLRTPLTRLSSAVQSALANPDDRAHVEEALAACVEEAELVLTLVRRFGDLAEAEAGLFGADRRPADLAHIVRYVVQLYEEIAEERGILVRVNTSGESVAMVDEGAMRRVVANLLDNALKYAPRGSEVSISSVCSDTWIELEVADHGCGISAEELPLIWQRLFRGDRSRARPGAGLGLSIVKAIVTAHRGTVSAASEPGRGTAFTVRLPAV